jgi:hypothetical protein
MVICQVNQEYECLMKIVCGNFKRVSSTPTDFQINLIERIYKIDLTLYEEYKMVLDSKIELENMEIRPPNYLELIGRVEKLENEILELKKIVLNHENSKFDKDRIYGGIRACSNNYIPSTNTTCGNQFNNRIVDQMKPRI